MNIEVEDFDFTPETTIIRGFWLDLGSSMEKDSGWKRIEWLRENRLEQVSEKRPETGTLYRNPADGKLWLYSLVAPHMRDGGPPMLELIDREKALELFGEVD